MNMEAKSIEFHKLLNGKYCFKIPVYQRRYEWETENVKKLYDDIVKLIENKIKKTHFIGSLVLKEEDIDYNTNYITIDGQQRIITLSLFLKLYIQRILLVYQKENKEL